MTTLPFPSTFASRVRAWAETCPDEIALRFKDLGVWRGITWSGYWNLAADVAHAMLALGIRPGDRVAVHSENRPEWLIADVATVAIRGITMGLYPTNPTTEVEYLLRDSASRILIAEDQEQVDKVLAVDELPELERIVFIEPRGVREYDDPRLMSWTEFVELGRRHRAASPGELDERMAAARDEDVAALIYTSGTTGPPKGAMLTVRNIEFSIRTFVEGSALVSPPPRRDDMILSYLPLCHVAERTFSTWFNAGAGCQIAFAESIETVTDDLAEVQPTIFLGVPRIWEKLHASIVVRSKSSTRVKRSWFQLDTKVAAWRAERLRTSEGRGDLLTRTVGVLVHLLLFRALLDRIGLRRCRAAFAGAAPISTEVLLFFMGIGVPVREIYGMTENCAIATANQPNRVKVGTVGEPHRNIELRLDGQTGEVLTRHEGVFAGYWGRPEASAETVDPDGWLRTGDVGEWVDGTHIRITDRMKDIIITAGGKDISPSEIENAIKASPYIKEAIVIGDKRKFITALIGIDAETVGDWALRARIPYTTYRDLTERQEVVELVERIVSTANERFARVEQVKAFKLLPKELDHDQGELTATQKVKRKAIEGMFADTIESMYRTESR